MTLSIRPARTPTEIRVARKLFVAYSERLDFDLCFQGFDAEMARFPGEYVPPAGDLLLAWRGTDAVGVVALRRFGDGIAEMKRLYLSDAARGLGAGRKLAEQVVASARSLGYRSLRLDTATSMTAAIRLYETMGFRRIAGPESATGQSETPELIYFELDL
ncbi:MAG: GNAT family N-acetyltransferase [Minwuia sp.]|nr:GNAT family N-acetyltransferase [Minwuia sp.]